MNQQQRERDGAMAPGFDSLAAAYDHWYDTPEGSAIFADEVECLRLLHANFHGRWLEVGVGSGRFAEALGITHGLDLSAPMASNAKQRGVRVCLGRAEQLPFQRHVFDGLLLALTMCFLQNQELAIQECGRVLRTNGKLVLGVIPADSPWGREYIHKGAEGHPVYVHARFRDIPETVRLVEKKGFVFRRGFSTLFRSPDNPLSGCSRVEAGIVAEAGFVGLLFDAPSAGVQPSQP
ncbi:MAG: class I SAM-dependent methyltransferase [Pseudomonadota bacterium]